MKALTDVWGVPVENKVGVRDFIKRLWHGRPPLTSAFYDTKPALLSNRIWRSLSTWAITSVSYGDPLYRYKGEAWEATQQAMTRLRRQGLSNAEAQRALPNELPHLRRLDRAEAEAIIDQGARQTFANPGGFAVAVEDTLKALEKGLSKFVGRRAAHLMFHSGIPFRRTIFNSVSKMFGRTPLFGAGLEYAKMRRRLAEIRRDPNIPTKTKVSVEASVKRQFAKEASWQISGPLIFAYGWYARANGQMHLAYPSNDTERDLMESGKFIPYSVKVPLFGWLSGRFLYPVSFPAWLGGIAYDGVHETDSGGLAKATENLLVAAFSYQRVAIEDIPSMQSVESLFVRRRTEDEETRAIAKEARELLIQTTASGAIPNIVKRVAEVFDPYKRENYHDDFMASVGSKFFNRIPGIRNRQPVEFDDLTGEPLTRTSGTDAKGTLMHYLLGAGYASGQYDGEKGKYVHEIGRLFDVGNTKTKPGDYRVSPGFRRRSEYPGLSEKKVMEINHEVARQTADALSELMETEHYKRASDEDKAKALKTARTTVAQHVWRPYEEYRRNYDPDEDVKPLTKRQLIFAQGGTPKYFSEWTPRQEIDYAENQLEMGEVTGKDAIALEFKIRKWRVQDAFHQAGMKEIYDTYHNTDKKVLLEWFARDVGMEGALMYLSDLARYENALIDAGVTDSRKFTDDYGNLETMSQIFSRQLGGGGKSPKWRYRRLKAPTSGFKVR